MLHLQDPFSRLHDHHAQFISANQQQQCAPPVDLATRLEDAKQRAIAALRRPHQPAAPTPLHQVQMADECNTNEESSGPRSSPCPPSRITPGHGRSLFERTSFRKTTEGNESGVGRSLEERISFAPSGPKADRDGQKRGRENHAYGSATGGHVGGGNKPFAFLAQDPQVTKVETAWNPSKWAAAVQASSGLYEDAVVVAEKAAEIPSPVPSPWKKAGNSVMEEYVPPPAVVPAVTRVLSTPIRALEQQNTQLHGITPIPLPLNLASRPKTAPSPPFQPLASAVWKTPQTASLVKPPRAPLPIATTSAPKLLGRSSFPASQPSLVTFAQTPHPSSSALFVPSSSALCFAPPHPPTPTPRPRLSSSLYVACLAAQDRGTTKVMLKCKMQFCADREGVTFAKESLRNGAVESYRQGFGCGGCGEMLDVVVCP